MPPRNHNSRLIAIRPVAFWTGLVVLALLFAAGAVLTWRKWPDLIVDFGQQLYIPWRISAGAVLYRDLFYMAGGPLSQYYHALLFYLFGPSFLVIIISNLTVTALMLQVCYRQFGRHAGLLCGFTITLAIVCVFCFAQYSGVGNYNYATPYSHEMLHGLFLSILALAALARWRDQQQVFVVAIAGVCLGSVALTKPDMFLALTAATFSAFIVAAQLGRTFLLRSAAVLLTAAAVPLLAFFIFFLPFGGWRESLRLEFFGWRPLFVGAVIHSPFYQACLGLDDPAGHLQTIALHTLIIGATVAACAWSVRYLKTFAPLTRWSIQAVLAWLVIVAAQQIHWTDSAASLPVLCVLTLTLLWRRWRTSPSDQTVFFPLFWCVFAFFLLAKQGLFPRLALTGFALAMPAFVCAIFLLGWELPAFLEQKHSVPPGPMRFLLLLVLFVGLVSLVQTSLGFYRTKHLTVGHGPDVIIATGPVHGVEARSMSQAVDWIQTNLPPAATLAAFPEGALLNYLSRHVNSTPCLDWNPTILAVFGETNMNATLKNRPPDYIALVEWEPYDFNENTFGSTNYAFKTVGWIQNNYLPVALFGSEPLNNGLFGIKILKHQDPPPRSRPAGTE